MVRSVTARARVRAYAITHGGSDGESVPILPPSDSGTVIADGSIQELDLDALRTMYNEGDHGEFQLTLAGRSWDDTPGEERVVFSATHWATREQLESQAVLLNFHLLQEGAHSWPGLNGQIVHLDWPNRMLRFRFHEESSFFDALKAVAFTALRAIGAVVIAGAILWTFVSLLASGQIVLAAVVGIAGALLFSVVEPTGLAWRAIKWLTDKISEETGKVLAEVANRAAQILQQAAKGFFGGLGGNLDLGGIALLAAGAGVGIWALSRKAR